MSKEYIGKLYRDEEGSLIVETEPVVLRIWWQMRAMTDPKNEGKYMYFYTCPRCGRNISIGNQDTDSKDEMKDRIINWKENFCSRCGMNTIVKDYPDIKVAEIK